MSAVTNVSNAVRTRLSARPPAMRGYPYAWLAIFLLGMILFRFVPSWADDQMVVFNQWIYFTILVIGFYFVFGVSGQFAFSQAAFAMVGGYTSAWATREGVDWILAVALGIAVAAVIAFLFAWLARKANLFFLAIATLALSELITEVIKQWKEFSGAEGAEVALTETQRIEIFGWKATAITNPTSVNERNLFWVYIVALAVVLLIGIWLARSPAKREAIAMRDQPTVAATSGIPTLRVRISMFVLGSSIGALAGSLFVHGRGFAQPQEFSVELGLGVFVMLIVGGMGSLWGPLLGAAFYIWVPYLLQKLDITLFGHEIRDYNQIIYGATLLLVMIFAPEGIIGLFHRLKHALQHRATARESRTWLSDFFGITKPPLVDVPVADDEPMGIPKVSAEARARAQVDGGTVASAALLKAAMEASQDRAYVRMLIERDPAWAPDPTFSNVTDFSLHARLYSHAEPLARRGLAFLDAAPLTRPEALVSPPAAAPVPITSALATALRGGLSGAVVDLTPPWAATLGLRVARVVTPDLMPLHGNHTLRSLGHPRLARWTEAFPRGAVSHPRPLWPYPHPMP